MREIKFRAWDGKMMRYDFDGLAIDAGGRVFSYRDLDDGLGETFEHEDRANWISLQFTGLMDKNGKEICEGDEIDHSLIVEWSFGLAAFIANDCKGTKQVLGIAILKGVEITGNIYEQNTQTNNKGIHH